MIDTKALRQKILDMAIRGQLVPQNPNDEPASVLLEKIRAEKQRLIKEGKIKKDKADSIIYKGDDNRYYENLPSGWVVCRLSDILITRTGATFNKGDAISQQAENYIRVLRGGNIEPYKIAYKNDDLFISAEKVKDTILLQQYDIITPAVTSLENIGKMACYMKPINDQMTVGGFVYLLTPYLCDLANSKFILYQLTSPIFIKSLQSISKKSGAAFYNINKEKLNNLPFYLPPYAEQVRIVEFIDFLFEQIELIDNNQSDIKKLYGDLKKKTLDLAIRGKLVSQDPKDEPAGELLKRIRAEKKAQLGKKYVESYIYKGDDNCYYEHINGKGADEPIETPFDIPENWCWCRLDDLAFYKKGPFGSSLTKDMFVPKSDTSVKVYEQKNAIYKDCNLGTYYISQAKYQAMKSFEVFPNDIIVSCAGTIGESYVLPPESPKGIINQALMRIKLINQNIVDFYLIYFDYILKAQAIKSSMGTAIKNIPPFDVLKRMLIPIPPLAEQQRIVDKINEIFAKL